MTPYKYITYDFINVKWDSPQELIEHIQDAWEKYGKTKVTFEVDYTIDYDSTYAEANLKCERPMTEKEREVFDAQLTLQKQQQEKYQRKQYEELKRKFGG